MEDEASRFEQVYREHANAVLAYARSRADAERAREVVGETFLVAWRRFDELPADPRTWLLGVARRVIANGRRSDARREALGVRIMAERAGNLVSGDAADIVIGRNTSLAVWNELPESDRELLALVAWGELSPAEAAKVIGCSKAAFLVRLHRARRRFEAALRHDDDASDVAPVVTVSSLLAIPKEPLT